MQEAYGHIYFEKRFCYNLDLTLFCWLIWTSFEANFYSISLCVCVYILHTCMRVSATNVWHFAAPSQLEFLLTSVVFLIFQVLLVFLPAPSPFFLSGEIALRYSFPWVYIFLFLFVIISIFFFPDIMAVFFCSFRRVIVDFYTFIGLRIKHEES